MEILTGLLVPIVALGPLVLLGFIWRRCHRRLRAKRYGPFAITGLFLTLLAACFLMLYPFAAFAAVFGSPVLWAGLALLLTRMLPMRAGSRHAGKRGAGRASVWGWLFIIVGGATWLFFSWQLIFPTLMTRADAWKGWFVVAGITMAASQYFFNIARRTKEAPETLPASAASVLYLRAFNEEERPFVFGPRSVLKKHTNQFAAHAPFQRGDPTLKLTLEDYLEEAITAQLGPFVGLGNPYDKLAPDGAIREYTPDDHWQARFLDLAQSATCIVVSIGGSANLEWELTQIKNRGLGRKLCLFTSPIVPGTDRKFLNRLRRTATTRAATIAADWTQARDVLRRAGFALAANPGPGAAVTFDEQGNSTIITTDATAPAEFITPVADWFRHGQKSGKCVPIACRTCGNPTHVTPSAAAESGECYACQDKKEHAEKSFPERHPVIAGIWGIAALALAVVSSQQLLKTSSMWIVLPLWAIIGLIPVMLPEILKARRVRAQAQDLKPGA